MTCRAALPPLAAAAWRRLRKCGRRSDRPTPTRPSTRSASEPSGPRYTAEMVAPILRGTTPRALAGSFGALTRVQDILGEHQDAIVAGDELTGLLNRETGDPSFTQAARLLRDRQAEAADAARDAYFDAWDRLDRRKARRWLKAGADRVVASNRHVTLPAA